MLLPQYANPNVTKLATFPYRVKDASDDFLMSKSVTFFFIFPMPANSITTI